MFAQLRVLDEAPRCTVYSLCRGEDADAVRASETTIFNAFVDAHKDGPLQDHLAVLLRIIERFGQKGAKAHYFRGEDYAVALPRIKDNPIRVYAIRFGEGAVVLLFGSIKSSQRAREGDTRNAFDEAQAVGRHLTELLADRELTIDSLETREAHGFEFEYEYIYE